MDPTWYGKKNSLLVGGFSSPIWKICAVVKLDHFPQVLGVKATNYLKPPGRQGANDLMWIDDKLK